MTLTFADHPSFHRTALRAALGAAGLSFLAAAAGLAIGAERAAAVVALGSLAALIDRRRPAVLIATLGALAAIAAAWVPSARPWLLAASGAALALGAAEARTHRARTAGEPAPGLLFIALATGLAMAAGHCLTASVPALALEAARFVPAPFAAAVSGALAGLWLAAAVAVVHLELAADAVEQRLAELRPLLLGELRPLVDRVAQARRGALSALQQQRQALLGPVAAALKTELDGLALAALDLARRGAELHRAAPPAAEDELTARTAELQAAATAAPDPIAQASYRRAAQTLEGQLEHLKSVRRGRERIAARLHEEVAQLERARFSLLLLQGANAERSAAELELLGGRLRHSASAFEAEAEATAEVSLAAASLRQRA